MHMKLYIDGDALPNILKPILNRAIDRLKIPTFAIANKPINVGRSKYIEYILVGAGADIADDRIVEMVEEGDLVITADIQLADRIITKNAHALDHRGKFFTEDNIKHYLSIRNVMQEFRDIGVQTQGPPPFKQKDAHEFANQLNNFLVKHIK